MIQWRTASPEFKAGGFTACSRWFREARATPPVADSKRKCTPEGCQQRTHMPSTHTSLHYHLIFATKNRETFITKEWRDKLHEYLGGTVRGLGGTPQGVGGVSDHVHLLVALKPTHCLSDFMRDLKKSSSLWVTDRSFERQFQWQEGYAAFTVSPTARESVQSYIANQEKHHQTKSFREELIEVLKQAEVEFDEQYLD
jgi:putative transposase